MNNEHTIITGATSGIGESCAYRLAKKRNLILIGRDQAKLQSVMEKCQTIGDFEYVALCLDLTNRDSFQEINSFIASNEIIVDCLVNNAGTGSFGDYADINDDDFDRVIDLNLKAVFLMGKIAVKSMLTKRKGTIINISSDADRVAFPDASAYSASKGGVAMLTKTLQEELQPKGIRVNLVAPGRVDTCFNGKKPGMRPGALSSDDVAEVVEFLADCSPNIEVKDIYIESMSR